MARPAPLGSRAAGAAAGQPGGSQLCAGREMNRVRGEGSGCRFRCVTPVTPTGSLARSAASSPSPNSRRSLNVLQNLAIGAGAVGSLQLTYISKVM